MWECECIEYSRCVWFLPYDNNVGRLLLKRKTNAKISSQTWFYRTRFQSQNRSVVRCAEKEKQKKSKEEIRRHTHILVRVEVSRGKGGDEYPPLTSTSDDRLQYRQYIQHGYWTVLDQREISSIANHRQRVSDRLQSSTNYLCRYVRYQIDTTNNQTFSSHPP